MGHEITLISFERKKKSIITDDQYFRTPTKPTTFNWFPMPYHKCPPVISTIYDLIQLRRKVKRFLKSKQFDIIHCRSYLTALIGLWAKKQYKIKFLFDMRGFWIEERVEGKLWNLNNPIYKRIFNYFKNKEIDFFFESDHIISLTANAIPIIQSTLDSYAKQITKKKPDVLAIKKSKFKNKVSIIPTCVNDTLFNPSHIDLIKQNNLRTRFGISKDEFLMMYSGSLGTWYMFDEMLNFFEHLLIKLPDAKFLILANNIFDILAWLKENEFSLFLYYDENCGSTLSHYKNIKNNIFITSVSHTEIPLYLSLATATICFIRPTFSKKGSFATKTGESWVMGKPVIINSGWGDMDKLITPGENGWLVERFNKTDYDVIIDNIIGEKINPEKIRSMALENLSLDKGVKKIDEIYHNLTN